jgi:hypothetical protein
MGAKGKRKSAFATWFRLQHGTRATWLPTVSDRELRRRIVAGQRAQDELRIRLEWDRRETSALYAWQASERERAT